MAISNQFNIVIPVYNSPDELRECLQSVVSQTYTNWQACVVDDASTDNTFDVAVSFSQRYKNITAVRNNSRKYMLYNRILASIILNSKNEDIIVSLDGDDEFYNEQALSILNRYYQDEKVWVTWGSFWDIARKEKGRESQPFDFSIPIRDIWCFSQLRTLKFFVMKNIPCEYLQFTTGEYYPICTDVAMMYPAIDMSGRDHCKYISEILYTYKNEVLFEGKTIPKYRSYSAETKKLKSEIISEIKTKKPLLNMDKEILCSRDSHPFAANLSDRCWENK